jgi:hypothetical protein
MAGRLQSLQGERRSRIISISLVPPYHCESIELLGKNEELDFIDSSSRRSAEVGAAGRSSAGAAGRAPAGPRQDPQAAGYRRENKKNKEEANPGYLGKFHFIC